MADEETIPGECVVCGTYFQQSKRGRRKLYCSNKCKELAAAEGLETPRIHNIKEQRKKMKELAFANMQDEVREIMRQEIRETISQHVKDNVLGAAEVMTEMLPTALAAIKQDLESEDWMSRSRAYALLMKYAMTFKDQEPEAAGNQNIVVVSGVPTPDTPLGHAVVEQFDQLQSGVEEFEKDWPQCGVCHQRKPESNMRDNGKGSIICTSCTITRSYKSGNGGGPDTLINRDPLFGEGVPREAPRSEHTERDKRNGTV